MNQFLIAAETNYPKHNGLKWHTLTFWESEIQHGLRELNSWCQWDCIPSEGSRRRCVPSLYQLLDAADIPWLIVTSSWSLLLSLHLFWLWCSCLPPIRLLLIILGHSDNFYRVISVSQDPWFYHTCKVHTLTYSQVLRLRGGHSLFSFSHIRYYLISPNI